MATDTKNEFLGTGRRKTAVARVRLASGNAFLQLQDPCQGEGKHRSDPARI